MLEASCQGSSVLAAWQGTPCPWSPVSTVSVCDIIVNLFYVNTPVFRNYMPMFSSSHTPYNSCHFEVMYNIYMATHKHLICP